MNTTISSSGYDSSKTTGECGKFQLLGSIVKNYARCTREINPGMPRQKQHLTRGGKHFSPAN
jgi:hypothetical protein